eukprot:1902888-Pyramimonas_sp.AAC.2
MSDRRTVLVLRLSVYLGRPQLFLPAWNVNVGLDRLYAGHHVLAVAQVSVLLCLDAGAGASPPRHQSGA